jgi:hypothetical protein
MVDGEDIAYERIYVDSARCIQGCAIALHEGCLFWKQLRRANPEAPPFEPQVHILTGLEADAVKNIALLSA